MAKYVFKTKPDPQQLYALKKALRYKRWGVFFEQRVGKTKVAIDFAGALHVQFGFKRILVIGPVAAIPVWDSQLEEHLGYDYKYVVWPQGDDKRGELVKAPVEKLTFIYVTSDSLSARIIKDKKTGKRHKTTPSWVFLETWNPDVIIFDEVHDFKDWKSNRSLAAYKLSKTRDYVMGLTGTPIAKRPIDIFGVFKVINDKVFGPHITKFRKRYCIMGGYNEVLGYKHKDEIAQKMAANSTRVLRRDVMDEPNVEYVTIKVPLEPKAREIYNDLRKNFIAELSDTERVTADIAGVRAMRLQQLCGGFLPDDETKTPQMVSTAKRDATVELIQRLISEGKKVVVFFRFVAEIEEMRAELTRKKIPVLVIRGGVSYKEREKYRLLFQNDERYMVILLQIRTGCASICLDAAHNNIYYSLSHRLLEFQQSRDRIMGRGQHNDVTNWIITISKSADEKIAKVIRADEDLASSIQDKWRWIMSE